MKTQHQTETKPDFDAMSKAYVDQYWLSIEHASKRMNLDAEMSAARSSYFAGFLPKWKVLACPEGHAALTMAILEMRKKEKV